MVTTQSSPQPGYRADIDGLRAVAVLPVVAFHAFPGWMPGGFVGVDVFFVISGFLITRDILQRQASASFLIGTFYRRRVHRLFPALALVQAATLAVGLTTLFPSEQQVLLGDLAASAGFVLNHWLVGHLSYFDTQAPLRPLLHLWSLAVEEQFYIVWPWLLIAWRRQPERLRIGLASFLTFASLAACVVLQPSHPSATYYLLPTRGWQLLSGALLALYGTASATASPAARANSWSGMAWIAGAALLAASFAFIDARQPYPGLAAVVPTLSAVLLLAASPAYDRGAKLLALPPLVAVGRISYPLYLWHWPMLAFLRIYEGGSPGVGARLAAVTLAVALAVLTERLVERRLRPIRGPASTFVLVTAVAVLGIAGLVGAAVGTAGGAGREIRTDADARRLDDVTLYGPHPLGPPCTADWRDRLPARAQCQQLGGVPSRAAVIGDSHAHHLFPGLQRADPNGRWSVLSTGSCPPLVGVRVHARWLDCQDQGETLVRVVAADVAIDTAILAFLGTQMLDTNRAAEHVNTGIGPAGTQMTDLDAPGGSKLAAFASGLARSVALLQQAGKRVVIVIDVPELPFEPRGCLARPLLGRKVADCSVPLAEVLERQAALRAVLNTLVTRYPSLVLFDTLQVLCNNSRCPVDVDGVIRLRDSHHLSARGSEVVVSALLRRLQLEGLGRER